jgi:transposase InsO family protein
MALADRVHDKESAQLIADVHCGDVAASALIDTGAARSAISEDAYNRIPEEEKSTITPSTLTLCGAGGGGLYVVGVAQVKVQQGKESAHITAHVITDLSTDIIIGNDTLQQGEGLRVQSSRLEERKRWSKVSFGPIHNRTILEAYSTPPPQRYDASKAARRAREDKTGWAAAIAALHIEESQLGTLWGSTPITPKGELTALTLGALVADAARTRARQTEQQRGGESNPNKSTRTRESICNTIHDNHRSMKLAIRRLARLRYRRRNPERWRFLAVRADKEHVFPARTAMAIDVKNVATPGTIVALRPNRTETGLVVPAQQNRVDERGALRVVLHNYSDQDTFLYGGDIIGRPEKMAEKEAEPAAADIIAAIAEVESNHPKAPRPTNLSPDGLNYSELAEALALDDNPALETEEQRKKATDLMWRFRSRFSEDAQYGCFNDETGVYHHVEVGDARPIRRRAYRLSPVEREVARNKIQKMLRQGLIRPSKSEWASPVVIVPKARKIMPDLSLGPQEWRFCVDYTGVNKLTKYQNFTLPRIETILDNMSRVVQSDVDGEVWFSAMDALSGYYQCRLDEATIPLSAFISEDGCFEWLVMPMGLKNSGCTYQIMMDKALRPLRFGDGPLRGRDETTLPILKEGEKDSPEDIARICKVRSEVASTAYVDDVNTTSRGFQKHLNDLEELFICLEAAHITLKTSKAHFFRKEIEHLGHKVTQKGIDPRPKHIETITGWPQPKTRNALARFLGLATYCRGHLASQEYLQTFRPLRDLIIEKVKAKKQPLKEGDWTLERKEAFEKVKQLFASAKTLAHPNLHPDAPTFIVETDASAVGIGAILKQVQPDGTEAVVSFHARGHKTKGERKASATDLEATAVAWAVQKLRHYLYGRKFIIRTDHSNLKWLLGGKILPGKQARQAETLLQYDFEIEYLAGHLNHGADALSRIGWATICALWTGWKPQPTGFLPLSREQEEKGTAITRAITPRWREYSATLIKEAPPMEEATTSADSRHWIRHQRNDPIFGRIREQLLKETGTKDFSWLAKPPPKRMEKAEIAVPEGCEAGDVLEVTYGATHMTGTNMVEVTIPQGVAAGETFIAEFDAPAGVESNHSNAPRAPLSETEKKRLERAKRHVYRVQNGLLFRICHTFEEGVDDGPFLRLCVPKTMRVAIITDAHTKGHLGTRKTLRRLQRNYFWPSMRVDTKALITNCPCARAKATLNHNSAPLHPIAIERPFDTVGIDVFSWPAASSTGNTKVLTVIDWFSRFPILIPIPNAKADTIAKALYDRFLTIFGIPRQICCDNGGEFKGVTAALLRMYNIKQRFTTPLHPQANGTTERIHRPLKAYLKTMGTTAPGDWDHHVSAFEFAMRTGPLPSIGISPFRIVFGREAAPPTESITGFDHRHPAFSKAHVLKFAKENAKRLHSARQAVRDEDRAKKQDAKDRFDAATRKPTVYNVGDRVRLHQPPPQTEVARAGGRKCAHEFFGPYVVESRNRSSYTLRHEGTGARRRAEVERMAPAREERTDFGPQEGLHAPPTAGTGIEPARSQPGPATPRRLQEGEFAVVRHFDNIDDKASWNVVKLLPRNACAEEDDPYVVQICGTEHGSGSKKMSERIYRPRWRHKISDAQIAAEAAEAGFEAITANYPPSWFVADSFSRNKDGTISPGAWEAAKNSGKVRLGRAIA